MKPLSQNPFALARRRYRLGQSALARRLGINRCYLSELENGREPSPQLLERLNDVLLSLPRRRPDQDAGFEPVPVVSWAKAGSAAAFEEIPRDWQHTVPTDCPDPQAFGLILEGDSMEPRYLAGDVVVVSPQARLRSHSLVAARLADRGVVFKILTLNSGAAGFRFTSFNPAYPPFEVQREETDWIYPAYEVRRRL